ncbi:MAG TPA: alpha/beta hydrolase family protein [Kofleriaceae bacterium]
MRLFALLALVACGSASKEPPAPAPAPITRPEPAPVIGAGKIERTKIKSEALGVEKDLLVYLPAGYDPAGTRRYPVFYYLHGLGGSETDWLEHGKIDRVADSLDLQAIIVMPDGDAGFYADGKTATDYTACLKNGTGLFDPGAPKAKTCVRAPKYETYMTRDLIAHVDTTYKTIASREGRAIAGLSMGGFGALTLALRHPDLYAAAVSHSGVDALLYEGPSPYQKGKVELVRDVKNWGGRLGPFGAWIRGIFGSELANWQAHDPASLVGKLGPGGPKLYLDCGTEDEFALHNHAAYLHDLLLDKKIDHEYFSGPGRHDFTFWAQRLPKSLAFLRTNTSPGT